MMSRGVSPRSRRRNRSPQRVAGSSMAIRSRMPAIRSALLLTAVLSITTSTYFAFSGDLTGLIGRQTKVESPSKDQVAELRAQIDRMSGQVLDQKQAEQELVALLRVQVDRIGLLEQHASAFTDLLTAGTIKTERFAPSEQMPAEKPTSVSTTNDTASFVTSSDSKTEPQSRRLPAKATTNHHRIHRAARQHASRVRGQYSAAERIALTGTAPAERRLSSNQLISVASKPYASITDQ